MISRSSPIPIHLPSAHCPLKQPLVSSQFSTPSSILPLPETFILLPVKMLTFQTTLILILLGFMSTIMCKTYSVSCTAGLAVYDHQNYLCKAFDDSSRTSFSRWKCPKPKVLKQQAKGSNCAQAPSDPLQPVKIPRVTCRDVYDFWSDSGVLNGIHCYTTEKLTVICTDMDQAASMNDCESL